MNSLVKQASFDAERQMIDIELYFDTMSPPQGMFLSLGILECEELSHALLDARRKALQALELEDVTLEEKRSLAKDEALRILFKQVSCSPRNCSTKEKVVKLFEPLKGCFDKSCPSCLIGKPCM